MKVHVLKADSYEVDYEATLINIFWNAMTHEERAAITKDGDIWSVPANLVMVVEV